LRFSKHLDVGSNGANFDEIVELGSATDKRIILSTRGMQVPKNNENLSVLGDPLSSRAKEFARDISFSKVSVCDHVSRAPSVDALERLAQVTRNKGTAMASPLQALVVRGLSNS
jgi:hypothetical protein